MVSDRYKQLEDRMHEEQNLFDDLVQVIADNLDKEQTMIEQSIYKACVAIGARPTEMAYSVNEFLVFLGEVAHAEIVPKP